MSLFKRFKMIAQAKANNVADKAENPTETIELGYQQLQDQQRKAKSGLAQVAASKKSIEIKMNDVTARSQKLADQARQAIEQGRDDIAREALSRRSALDSEHAALQESFDAVAARQETLEQNIKTFDAKLRAFATQKEVIKARYASAQASVQANEAFSGIGESAADIGLALQRAQDKTTAMEARAAGMTELMESGALDDLSATPTDDIQAALDAGGSNVDLELEKMKRELGAGGGERKALESGSTESDK